MEVDEHGDQVNDAPVEQVRLTIPINDDPTLPTLTFRTWLLGLSSCILRAFSHQFFTYRQYNIPISSMCFQIMLLAVGKFMAATLPSKPITVPGTKYSFSMNPGPFNKKEHVLISLIGYAGDATPYSNEIVTLTKIFYHKKIHVLVALLLSFTSQMIGYGYAGFFVKFLVYNPYMWWPDVLVDVTLYRLLHEVESKLKGQLTRFQFFQIAFLTAFAYFIVPGYFFPSISALSFVCWIWKGSVTAQQIGSGLKGLGLGTFTLDWYAILKGGDPLVTPTFVIINHMVGFILVMYIFTPIAYWTNSFNAKTFPMISSDLFDDNGQVYNISRVLDKTKYTFDNEKFNNYSKIHLSPFNAISFGFTFAAIAGGLTHVVIFYGRNIWGQVKDASRQLNDDVHSRLMKKYKAVPQWWYYMILIVMIPLAIVTCTIYGNELQLPLWGLALAIVFGFICTLPVSVIEATTGQFMDTGLLHDLVIGYLYPGRPLAFLTYKAFSLVCSARADYFISTFKLGYYMKIPPRSMFVAQVVATMVSTFVSITTTWWILSSVKDICHPELLPRGSPWTCPMENLSFDYSVLWGVVGPANVFAPHGLYSHIYLFILLGVLGPILISILIQVYPKKKWLEQIHLPVILNAASRVLPWGAVSYLSFYVVGITYNVVVFRKFKGWWAKYNYALSLALSSGPSFMTLVLFLALQRNDIYGINWWGLDLQDHCPLAQCPTAPGIKVDGCPVLY